MSIRFTLVVELVDYNEISIRATATRESHTRSTLGAAPVLLGSESHPVKFMGLRGRTSASNDARSVL